MLAILGLRTGFWPSAVTVFCKKRYANKIGLTLTRVVAMTLFTENFFVIESSVFWLGSNATMPAIVLCQKTMSVNTDKVRRLSNMPNCNKHVD